MDPLREAFAAIGLPSRYGGVHSNGVTHMALLSFADGSYVELISMLEAGHLSPWWHAHITGDGGPCAWAVRTGDMVAEAARVAASGVPVRGPVAMQRARPDGRQVRWELAFLGDGEPGAVLPFVIQDRSPREWRVPPEALVAAGVLSGVAAVVLGVADLDMAGELFRHVYDWPNPDTMQDAQFGARLAHFPGTPVVLAAPLEAGGWLVRRLARFGESPCAFLLGAPDIDAAGRVFRLDASPEWFGRRVAWFDADRLGGTRLGVIQA